MQIKSLDCLWLLGNVDESILKLNDILDHGFTVHEIDILDEEIKILQKLERLQDNAGIFNRLEHDYNCKLYKKVYCIKKTFDVPVDELGMVRFDKIDEKDRGIIHDYVPSFVSKIRLFKEGNLCIPVSYTYFNENGEIISHTKSTWLKSEFSSHFTLENSELQELKDFMQDLRIPFSFEKPFLQNAFELFEMSY